MVNEIIPTYIINLKHRNDRRLHSIQEFANRPEFNITFVEAKENNVGAVGLWNSLKSIISNVPEYCEYILICEDDHCFTADYSYPLLLENIKKAKSMEADILLGGASSVHSLFEISESLLWVEGYTGNQFIIVYRNFFSTILSCQSESGEPVDIKFSSITQNIYLIYPFISIQQEFGYSDVTHANCKAGHVSELFVNSRSSIKYVLDSAHFYGYNNFDSKFDFADYGDISLPVYVINLPERRDRLEHIKNQFHKKKEFDVVYTTAISDQIGALGLWKSVRNVIQLGIDNNDDLLIICEDDHIFTENYSKEILFRNVIQAHQQGVDILWGGTSGGFAHALPVATNRFWLNHCLASQFIVIYKKIFKKIIDAAFDESVTTDNYLSELTPNKMVIYPFISLQKDFGYSDISGPGQHRSGMADRMFKIASERLNGIWGMYDRYGPK